jgi:hypothetical protein
MVVEKLFVDRAVNRFAGSDGMSMTECRNLGNDYVG